MSASSVTAIQAEPPGGALPVIGSPHKREPAAEGTPAKGKSDAGGRFIISKAFSFSASHELWMLPETHKCRRNHGHNYVVTLTLAADRLDHWGFVTDFGDLAPFGDYLKTTFDHRLLNEQVDFHPTSELLAAHCGGWFIDHLEPRIHGRLMSVQVSETASSSATWIRGDEW